MVRSGRDGQLVHDLGRVLRDEEDRPRAAVRPYRPLLGRLHDVLLADHRVRQPADQPRAADRVLPESASVGPGLGEGSARKPASATPRRRCYSDAMGKATLGWISGCLTIWSSLFAIGNFLYGRTGAALTLTAVFVVSGVVLLYVTNTLWDREAVTPQAVPR